MPLFEWARTRVPLGLRSVWLAVIPCLVVWPAMAAETIAPPSAAKDSRQDAQRAIPFHAMRQDAAQEIHQIVSKAAMYRRLPVVSGVCDPDLFVFWVRNPDVIVGIWEQMGVTQISMRRTGQFRFDAADGAGTTSALELIYSTPNLHLFKGTGFYEGGLIKRPVRGDCVVLLRNDFRDDRVVCRMDVFVSIEQAALEIAAKTLQPLFVRYADLNFVETMDFVERLSAAAVKQGDRMSGLAHRLDRVQPHIQYEFAELAARASQRVHGTADPMATRY